MVYIYVCIYIYIYIYIIQYTRTLHAYTFEKSCTTNGITIIFQKLQYNLTKIIQIHYTFCLDLPTYYVSIYMALHFYDHTH